jgi:4a-hydroxytetrahydrobiopterin dehydratase
MENNLSKKHCVPCEGGTKPLSLEEASPYVQKVNNWVLDGDSSIEKILVFKDFRETLEFVNKVGKVAEEENHHPDILIFGWNKVKLTLSTHAIQGLSENDFILAAKIDDLIRTNN